MSRPFQLEDLDATLPDPGPMDAHASPEEDYDSIKLASYETGYKSGWDDAIRATEADARHVSAELGRNLRDLGFTYIEARDEVLEALRPFLSIFIDTLFPTLLPESVAAIAIREISEAMAESMEPVIAIVVSPEDGETVRSILGQQNLPNLQVQDEPALASGQARLGFGTREVSIDLDSLVERLRGCIDSGDSPEQGQRHG